MLMPLRQGKRQGGVAALYSGVDVGSVVQQQTNHFYAVAVQSRHMQTSMTVAVEQSGVRAAIQKQLDDLPVPGSCNRGMQCSVGRDDGDGGAGYGIDVGTRVQ